MIYKRYKQNSRFDKDKNIKAINLYIKIDQKQGDNRTLKEKIKKIQLLNSVHQIKIL